MRLMHFEGFMGTTGNPHYFVRQASLIAACIMGDFAASLHPCSVFQPLMEADKKSFSLLSVHCESLQCSLEIQY